MVKEGVKMVDLTHDSALTDSDAVTRLVHKISALMPQSAQFVAQPNPSIEQKPSSPCLYCRDSAEGLNTKKAITRRPPQYSQIVH
ncbi:hypothetical protein ACTXT7_003125 [Hymenolepis weldensis]